MKRNLPERGTVSWSLMMFQVSGTCARHERGVKPDMERRQHPAKGAIRGPIHTATAPGVFRPAWQGKDWQPRHVRRTRVRATSEGQASHPVVVVVREGVVAGAGRPISVAAEVQLVAAVAGSLDVVCGQRCQRPSQAVSCMGLL